VRDELLRIGQPLPDLRQESRALAFLALFENDPVHAGAQPRNQLGVVLEQESFGRRQKRYLDVGALEFVGRERLEARVLERRGAGVLGDVSSERPLRVERAYAAAQLFAVHQGDEGRARLPQPGLLGDRRAGLPTRA